MIPHVSRLQSIGERFSSNFRFRPISGARPEAAGPRKPPKATAIVAFVGFVAFGRRQQMHAFAIGAGAGGRAGIRQVQRAAAGEGNA
jgi:hypothetical protein